MMAMTNEKQFIIYMMSRGQRFDKSGLILATAALGLILESKTEEAAESRPLLSCMGKYYLVLNLTHHH
jgi:hypothetical protein